MRAAKVWLTLGRSCPYGGPGLIKAVWVIVVVLTLVRRAAALAAVDRKRE
jgi:hypothetical protein